MKIIFVISALRNGGAERVLQILANGICDEFDVKIAYFELIALIYSDGEVPPIEADILRRLEPVVKTKELENLAISLTNQLNFVKTIELLNARSK